MIFLTAVFHYFGLSIVESLAAALILSLMLDGAYIFHLKTLRKTEVEATKEGKLTRGDYIVLAIIILDCLVFGTLGINHILVVPLAYSFLISSIITVVAALVYIAGVRKWRRERKRGRKIYSIRQFLLELAIASVVFLPAYLAGVGLLKSLAIALYVYLLIHWYYNFKPHIYVFPKEYLILRSVLVFSGTFLGWLTLVKANPIVCFLIAALTAFMLELDRRSGVRLAKAVGFEEMEKKVQQSWCNISASRANLRHASWRDGCRQHLRYAVFRAVDSHPLLAYIFTPPFLTIEALIGWIYVKSGKLAGVNEDMTSKI